ncbi:MAG: transcription termination/antitermination NusG family protein [Dehalococcoidia bacterium]
MKQWHVARAKPHKESVLMAYLAHWGVEVFFPQVRRPAQKSGEGQRMEALFPTYLFCRIDRASSQWPVARWAMGLAHFLSFDGQPATVPDDLVEYLRDRVQEWNGHNLQSRISQGDRVTVTLGPFAGLEGMFQQYVPSRHRCRILLESIGGLRSVELPESSVWAATAAHRIAV